MVADRLWIALSFHREPADSQGVRKKSMIKNSIKILALALALAACSSFALMHAAPAAQQPTVTRKILLKQDSTVPGYEEALVAVEIPVGGREGRHTHPGSVMIYVQEGTLTFDYEGKPTATYNPGDAFYVESGKIHEGINNGKTSVKVIASFFLKKGEPMTSPAK
jgi:quercetin dioxygenase-like cupin family protein